jgi:hypothetical protein
MHTCIEMARDREWERQMEVRGTEREREVETERGR